MKYYKIVIDKEIKGVANSFNFFIENNGKLISSTDSLGQFTEYEGVLYRDYWMPPIPDNKRVFFNAIISEISREEYFAYLRAKEKNELIINDNSEEEPELEPIVVPTEDIEEIDTMLEYVRSSKITEMSNTCHKIIETGIDLEIRNEMRHFSLTTQDLLNLMSLNAMAATLELIPYHADGEACIFYTAAEIQLIVAAATAYKIYHTTYYNALKNYINALETIEDIAAITYGVDIPEEYQTDVLKALLANENNN